MQDASRASLRLLAAAATRPGRTTGSSAVIRVDRRRAVDGVGRRADVNAAARPGRLDRAVVAVAGAVEWSQVAAVHIDGADAGSAVREAVAVIDAADLGDDDAEFALGSVEDFDLAWYAPGEIVYLVEELDASG